MSYEGAHNNVRRLHGAASDHACVSCGGPALDWAYQYGAPDEQVTAEGLPYSMNPQFYEPMCRSCHMRYDNQMDERVGDAARARGIAFSEKGQAWRDANPERSREIQLANMACENELFRNDPAYRGRKLEALRRGGIKANSRRRKCVTCGLTTTPGAMGKHMRYAGHSGYGLVEGEIRED